MYKEIHIKSSQKEYEVSFVDDIFTLIQKFINDGSFLVVDSKIYDLYLKEKLDHSLLGKKILLIEAEEQNKNIESSQKLIQTLVENSVKRSSKIVAIGGGITQDIVCFTSSILFRGVPWVFIPTTLLAQADSCIGGKSSINFRNVKNLIGTFNPPDNIYIDPIFLNSLSEEDVKSGIGEMYHYFFHSASPLIQDFHNDRLHVLSDRSLLVKYIYESLTIKKEVIEIDEFDRGVRRKFNYGHTFGHAIEALTDYQVNHGQAVTIGMDLANFLSFQFGLISENEYNSMSVLLRANFPKFSFSSFSIEEYTSFLQKDKKNVNSNLTCILTKGAGHLEVYEMELNDTNKSLISTYFAEEYLKPV
ncbi:AroB-related putative sugar phosphate phospholyase (cyclizing) [Leptospira limi]|uniref:3-dehydroquinate synthase n=1 Tax=Leptospira limi TaxID=2950023 RepID=A0ABT3LZ10_9LEPT|nr:AroB-related putative sugar phosphate phospholyase (cyclizing) [Leptospira limi]MCW7462960.1 3-dehydroquinate synthase [Leptospira limi]